MINQVDEDFDTDGKTREETEGSISSWVYTVFAQVSETVTMATRRSRSGFVV